MPVSESYPAWPLFLFQGAFKVESKVSLWTETGFKEHIPAQGGR